MFRRLALAVALAAAAAATGAGCGKRAPARHEVVPGAKAGVVLEVSGAVTATRPGAAARPLAKGDAVSGDDVIETGADGAVLIELDHNHVTFTLPAGKQQAVATSLAWTQPVAAARPTTTDEHSAAAGRAIERSAVDTAASSSDEAPRTAGTASRDPEATTARPPAQPVAPPDQQPRPQEPKPRRTDPVPEHAPKIELDRGAKPEDGPRLEIRSGASAGADNGAAAAGGGGRAADDAYASDEVAGAPSVPTDPFALTIEATGGLLRDDLAGVLDVNKVRACFAKLPARTTIIVTPTGTAGRVTTDGGQAATTCVRDVLKAVTFPARKTETTVKIDLSPTG